MTCQIGQLKEFSVMTTIIVLFNLKPGIDRAEYENWAKSVDLPTVRNLDSIDGFRVLRTTGVLGAEGSAPYEYIEVIDISEWEQFGKEIATEMMQKVAGQFQGFADNPQFIMSGTIE
jgi:hypothetical protein